MISTDNLNVTERVIKPATLLQTKAEFLKDFVPPDYLIDGMLQRRFIYS